MKHFYIAVVILFFVVPHSDVSAQWTQSTNLEGGSIVTDIVEYKNALYIAVLNSGVYRSVDNGVSWTRTTVPPQPNFAHFAVFGDKLLVFSYGKIFHSADGQSFTEMVGVNDFVEDVATDGTTLVIAGIQGIYVTSNFASSWTKANDTRTQTEIASVTVKGSVILAAARSRAGIVFKSVDGGVTWAETNTGSHAVTQLAYQGSTAFMNVNEIGLLRSNDDGTTWQQVRTDNVGWRFALTSTHIYYVGRGTYAVSSNQGNSWLETLDGPPSGLNIQSFYAGASYIFTGTWGAGTYRKPLDNTAPWTSCNAGLSFQTINDIDIKDDTILAGAEYAFIWKSMDEGQTWTRRLDGLASATANAIVRMGNDIFVATGTIYRSSDEGENWVVKSNSSVQGTSSTLAVLNNKLYTNIDNDVYVSANRGDSWEKKSDGLLGPIRTIFADDKHVYVGTYQGLFRLNASGERWDKIDMGVPSQSVGKIAKLGSILLVAEQYDGVYKSIDDGKTWTLINNNIVLTMAVRNNEIYAAALTGALYHSSDSGKTWSDIKGNIPSRVVTSISFTSKHVLVGAAGNGLWLRPIGELAPPYFYFPSLLTDSTFLKDEPIVIRADQPMQTQDGNPVSQSDLEDLITITTLDGTPANYTATLGDDLLTITIKITEPYDNTAYRITIAPVANAEGLESTAQSFTLRAVMDAAPVVGNISFDMPQRTTFTFTAALFTTKYSDHEGSPLAKIKVTTLPAHGALKVGGNVVVADAEISPAQLTALTYTPSADFVGTDQWAYAASDGKSYSNSAQVIAKIFAVTDIHELTVMNLTLYPNPVDRILTILPGNVGAIDELNVVDMRGSTIRVPMEKYDASVVLDFTAVPSGMYVLSIRSGKRQYHQKVLRR
ncbi:T9SS type A sorting domain-containing protein [Chryseolinea sp. T2]|uniref:T9SS type A sorting domain-containing protein n=1 Tax=Chryseolinea sp. T2 TaxID=3129255 RepID=UPI0030783943